MEHCKKHIIIIDDDKTIAKIIREMIITSPEFNITTMDVKIVDNIEEGKKVIDRYSDNIYCIFIDLAFHDKPEGGKDILIHLALHDYKISSVVVSGNLNTDNMLECKKLGAWEFIKKPFSIIEIQAFFKEAVKRYNAQETKNTYSNKLSQLIVEQADKLLSQYDELKEQNELIKLQKIQLQDKHIELKKLYDNTIEIVSNLVEINDPYTSGHMKRVALIALLILYDLELEECSEKLYIAAYLHDIGKVGIPTGLLSRPTTLTKEEFELVKTHVILGYELLLKLDSKIAEVVYQHHEKEDGTGYPRKLKENEILVTANILTFADIVEALNSFRPYRPAFNQEEIIEYLNKNKSWFKESVFESGCRLYTKGYFDEILKGVESIYLKDEKAT